MPRQYTRKTTWGKTPLEEMESAAAEVKEGKKSIRAAARDRYIDMSSLLRFIKKKEKGDANPSTAHGPHGCASPADSDVPRVPSRPGYESSEDERSDQGNTDLSVGDFVIVNFATKHRSVRYIGMVKKVEDDEILAQFLRRIQGNTKEWERPTFAIKENDVAHVPKSDVVKKLPQPKRPGGTTRREQLLIFPCNLQGWNVE